MILRHAISYISVWRMKIRQNAEILPGALHSNTGQALSTPSPACIRPSTRRRAPHTRTGAPARASAVRRHTGKAVFVTSMKPCFCFGLGLNLGPLLTEKWFSVGAVTEPRTEPLPPRRRVTCGSSRPFVPWKVHSVLCWFLLQVSKQVNKQASESKAYLDKRLKYCLCWVFLNLVLLSLVYNSISESFMPSQAKASMKWSDPGMLPLPEPSNGQGPPFHCSSPIS